MNLLRRKPWLLVIAGLAFFIALDVALLCIAIAHPPEPWTP
jgi:hypothetical protein